MWPIDLNRAVSQRGLFVMPTHNSKTSENQRKSGMSNQNRGFRVHKTRPNRSQNHSRTTRENQLAESPELTTRWNEAVAKAEIIARLVPNDDADETTILCYMRNWCTATVRCHRKLHI